MSGLPKAGLRSTRSPLVPPPRSMSVFRPSTSWKRSSARCARSACCELPGSDSRILREGNFLPLEQDEASQKLLELYDRSAAGLGFRVCGEATGGSADSGFTAALGTPTLCGTGPVGGNAHTDEEWCRIDTIVPRAQALALTILEVAAGPP